MDTTVIVVLIIAAAVVAVVAIAAWVVMQKWRSNALRKRFGPEYDRVVDKKGDLRRAEAELAAREKRVEGYPLRPLAPEERQRFAEAWRATQARFVDEPSAAIREADRLVTEVMEARGYPVGRFEQQAADVSVDHPHVVSNYRAARAIAQANQDGRATTENLREAMVHYRALFEDLLESPTTTEKELVR
jgi:hypothetical protein